ncbi:hypothetical protein [Paenibacillus vini]|uniref:LysM domain-containing protein n=1 Tax=Paenibacillus vini TaxID=1476024 RepID=A0ABQ4MCY5_9BACL|nr:hypothetical protein [Paenibacillus vini]GIP53865.1 hypothetical protein J42TS3_29000 [Paenibacillus vini]
MKNKAITASALALAITLGGGAVLAGQAFAASDSNTTSSTSSATQRADKGTLKGKGGHHGIGVKLDNTAIAALFGMTETELETAERSGKSLAAVAEEKGISLQSVIDLVAKQLTARLDQKLADGSLTQTQYDTEKANVTEKANKLVNRELTGKASLGGHGGARIDEEAVAELLGISISDYETAKHAGKSMAALAEEKGVALQSVVELVTSQLTTALDKQLADGKITQSQFDTAKTKLAAKALEIVKGTRSDKAGHHGHGSRSGTVNETEKTTEG